ILQRHLLRLFTRLASSFGFVCVAAALLPFPVQLFRGAPECARYSFGDLSRQFQPSLATVFKFERWAYKMSRNRLVRIAGPPFVPIRMGMRAGQKAAEADAVLNVASAEPITGERIFVRWREIQPDKRIARRGARFGNGNLKHEGDAVYFDDLFARRPKTFNSVPVIKASADMVFTDEAQREGINRPRHGLHRGKQQPYITLTLFKVSQARNPGQLIADGFRLRGSLQSVELLNEVTQGQISASTVRHTNQSKYKLFERGDIVPMRAGRIVRQELLPFVGIRNRRAVKFGDFLRLIVSKISASIKSPDFYRRVRIEKREGPRPPNW